jgi:predicted enzyme related to lactoylglutathione lyase
VEPIGSLTMIQVDAEDPRSLADFWSAVFGRPVVAPLGDPPHYVGLEPIFGEFAVSFVRVPEPKATKNRLHFDVWVDDVDRAQESIESLGGQHTPVADYHEYGFQWRQMTDPEGNEFCLIYEAAGDSQ